MPIEIKKMKLKKHDISAYVHTANVMVLAWQDNRQVLMLNTFHDLHPKQYSRKPSRDYKIFRSEQSSQTTQDEWVL